MINHGTLVRGMCYITSVLRNLVNKDELTKGYHGLYNTTRHFIYKTHLANYNGGYRDHNMTHKVPELRFEPSCTSHPLPAQEEKNITRSAGKA